MKMIGNSNSSVRKSSLMGTQSHWFTHTVAGCFGARGEQPPQTLATEPELLIFPLRPFTDMLWTPGLAQELIFITGYEHNRSNPMNDFQIKGKVHGGHYIAKPKW